MENCFKSLSEVHVRNATLAQDAKTSFNEIQTLQGNIQCGHPTSPIYDTPKLSQTLSICKDCRNIILKVL